MTFKSHIMGIAGPSCGGKTCLANRIVQSFPELNPQIFLLDAYYKDLSHLPFDKRKNVNFDSPEALDWERILRNLELISKGANIEQPVYDFKTHTLTKGKIILKPEKLVIVEGLYALFPLIFKFLNSKIYVDLSQKKCLARRIKRDVSQRGRTAEDVITQFKKHVSPMYLKHVLPTKTQADLVLAGDALYEDSLKSISVVLGF